MEDRTLDLKQASAWLEERGTHASPDILRRERDAGRLTLRARRGTERPLYCRESDLRRWLDEEFVPA